MRAARSQLRAFLGAFSPEIGRIALRARAFVLEQAPMANEFVSDADDSVAMRYGFTTRPADAFCHVAVHAGWVSLGFDRGCEIPDPEGLLQGGGGRIRHIRFESLDDLRRPFVGRFLRAAMESACRTEAGGRPKARVQEEEEV